MKDIWWSGQHPQEEWVRWRWRVYKWVTRTKDHPTQRTYEHGFKFLSILSVHFSTGPDTGPRNMPLVLFGFYLPEMHRLRSSSQSLYRFSEPFSAYVKRSWMFGSANIWRHLSCFALPLQNNRKHCALFHTLRDTLLSHLLVCRPSISQDVMRFHWYTQWLVIRVDEKLFLFPFAITSRKTMQGWILQRGFPENKLIKSCYSCCRKVIAGTNWYPHAHIFIIKFTSSYLKSRTEIGHDFATSLLSSHSSGHKRGRGEWGKSGRGRLGWVR